jgi:hypothetical protein
MSGYRRTRASYVETVYNTVGFADRKQKVSYRKVPLFRVRSECKIKLFRTVQFLAGRDQQAAEGLLFTWAASVGLHYADCFHSDVVWVIRGSSGS